MANNQIISTIKVDTATDNGKSPVYNSTTKVFDMTTPAAGGGWTTLSSGTMGSNTGTIIDLTGISTSYNAFRIKLFAIGGSASYASNPIIIFNSDTGANYETSDTMASSYSGALPGSIANVNAGKLTGITAGRMNPGSQLDMYNGSICVFEITIFKPLSTKEARGTLYASDNTGNIVQGSIGWNNTSSKITGIKIYDNGSSTYEIGTYWLIEAI